MTHEHEHDHEHGEDEAGGRHFYGVVPVFLVDDVLAAATYYRDNLSFEVDFVVGDPAAFGSVSRDEAVINFSKAEPAGRRNSTTAAGAGNGVDIYIVVSDIDGLYTDFKAHGVRILAELESHSYGMRDFVIEDPNGYRISLAEEIEGE